MLRFSACFVLLMAGTLGIAAGNSTAHAEDFRVDNAVYPDNQKTPSSESVTIFHDGMVYDCMKSPAETVVFDRVAGRFLLLNAAARTRAELATSDVTAFTARIQESAPRHPDPIVKFLADPRFQERFDPTARELSLGSPLVTYRATLSAEETPEAVAQYREFSDWYAKLNAMLAASSCRPPFGRLMLNRAIADRKAIASQVVLVMTLSPGRADGRQTTVRSTHRVVRPLTTADLDRVAQVRGFLRDFKQVGFEKYRKNETK